MDGQKVITVTHTEHSSGELKVFTWYLLIYRTIITENKNTFYAQSESLCWMGLEGTD